MRHQKVSFRNQQEQPLSGSIDFPLSKKPRAYVLFAHCFTCSKNLKSVDHMSRAFTNAGMAILRFDFTGLGSSKGEFSDTNFSSNLSDLQDAYHFLEKNYTAPQILVGHSLGGAAVIHAAARMPNVKAVATIGAPSSPLHVSHLLSESKEELAEKGEARINIGGRPFKIKKQFLDDLEANDSKEVIKGLNRALLIMHSPQDEIVGIDCARDIYEHAMHPKSFITLDGANHLMTKENDAVYAGFMVASWAVRYIAQTAPEEAPEGEVVTRLSGQTYTTELVAGRHHLIADEPLGVGGKDRGPTPYGYLLSALGACTAMTLRMYANHKKIDLEEVEVRLTHHKIHKKDGESSENTGGKIDQIKISIRLEGNLTAEQKTRMLEIAGHCPVHKTIKGTPEIIIQPMS